MGYRSTAIALARFHGYHADKKAFTRLIIERPRTVSANVLQNAWTEGEIAKTRGVGCRCPEHNPKAAE